MEILILQYLLNAEEKLFVGICQVKQRLNAKQITLRQSIMHSHSENKMKYKITDTQLKTFKNL